MGGACERVALVGWGQHTEETRRLLGEGQIGEKDETSTFVCIQRRKVRPALGSHSKTLTYSLQPKILEIWRVRAVVSNQRSLETRDIFQCFLCLCVASSLTFTFHILTSVSLSFKSWLFSKKGAFRVRRLIEYPTLHFIHKAQRL